MSQTTLIYIICSVIATMFMTGFMYLASGVINKNMYVVKILSKMLFSLKSHKPLVVASRKQLFIGWILHYMIGVYFGIAYPFLAGFLNIYTNHDLIIAFVIGCIYGAAGVAGWATFFALHPAPDQTVERKPYLLFIFIAHVVFALTLYASTQLIKVG